MWNWLVCQRVNFLWLLFSVVPSKIEPTLKNSQNQPIGLLCLVCVAVEVASSGRASFRNLDVRLYNWTQFFSSYSWIAFCNSLKDVRSLSLKALSIMSLYMFSYYYNSYCQSYSSNKWYYGIHSMRKQIFI
jgi:hypothetical protein